MRREARHNKRRRQRELLLAHIMRKQGHFQNVGIYKNEDVKLKSTMFRGTVELRTQEALNLCEESIMKMDFF